jgi:hypothetical protein
VASSIFSIIMSVILRREIFISLSAPRRKHKNTLRFAGLSKIVKSLVRTLPHANILAPRFWRWILEFWKTCEHMYLDVNVWGAKTKKKKNWSPE